MAIQYSGNAQTSTFTPSVKQDIINDVETALLAAGWTTISGHATTNLLMQSATTPQGFAINVRLKDNGGTCVTFSLESTDGVLVGGNSTTVGGGWLNPGSGLVYRVTCNQYQAFIYVTPDPGASRTFVAFGVPFVPSWVASITTRVGWMESNALSDTSTTIETSFRTALVASISLGAQQAMYNSTLWSFNVTNSSVLGLIGIPSFVSPNNSSGSTGYRWESGSALIIDALICWGDTATTVEAKFKGQLWDAVISTDAYTGDDTTTFDSHNWICVTDNNVAANLRGTLLIATS